MNARDDAPDPRDAPGESSAPDAPDAPDESLLAFTALLRALRALPGPCAPPVGSGAFDILYANEREIVVWHMPARDGLEQREVTIPARLARAAWDLIRRGAPVDELALRALAPGAAGARWLLCLLAQVPGVETIQESFARQDNISLESNEADMPSAIMAEERVSLIWRGER